MRSQEPGTSSRSPTQVQEPKTLGRPQLLSQATSRELDGKWSCSHMGSRCMQSKNLATKGYCAGTHFLLLLLFLKMYFIFHYKVRYTQRRIYREEDLLSSDSPSGCNGRCYADLKPGARNFFQVSHVSTGAQGPGPSSTAFPGHKRGTGWEAGLLGLEPAAICYTGTCKARNLTTRLPHLALGCCFEESKE